MSTQSDSRADFWDFLTALDARVAVKEIFKSQLATKSTTQSDSRADFWEYLTALDARVAVKVFDELIVDLLQVEILKLQFQKFSKASSIPTWLNEMTMDLTFPKFTSRARALFRRIILLF